MAIISFSRNLHIGAGNIEYNGGTLWDCVEQEEEKSYFLRHLRWLSVKETVL